MRWAVDEFVLVVAVHALGESIIVGIAHGPDRRYCTEFGEPFAVADRGELTARIAVAAQPGQPCAATEAGHLDGVEHYLGAHVRRDAPAHDHPRVSVGDEADVAHSRPGRDVGEVGDPQLVRLSRSEIPPNQIGVPIRPGRCSGGTHLLPSPHTSDLLGTHQPRDLVTADIDARSSGCFPQLPHPIYLVILLPQPP